MLTVLFTAVTAAGSAQLISVSSLVTYDVFRTYQPSSTGRQLMKSLDIQFLVGLGMALASLLFMSGVSLQYVSGYGCINWVCCSANISCCGKTPIAMLPLLLQ